MSRGSRREIEKCSFCGKSRNLVDSLIAGPPGIYICNECVELCSSILVEEVRKAAPTQAELEKAAIEDEKTAQAEPFSTFSLHVGDVSFKLAHAAPAPRQGARRQGDGAGTGGRADAERGRHEPRAGPATRERDPKAEESKDRAEPSRYIVRNKQPRLTLS